MPPSNSVGLDKSRRVATLSHAPVRLLHAARGWSCTCIFIAAAQARPVYVKEHFLPNKDCGAPSGRIRCAKLGSHTAPLGGDILMPMPLRLTSVPARLDLSVLGGVDPGITAQAAAG